MAADRTAGVLARWPAPWRVVRWPAPWRMAAVLTGVLPALRILRDRPPYRLCSELALVGVLGAVMFTV